MSRIYIDRYTGSIERTDVYRVAVTLKDGTRLTGLEPRRLFPAFDANRFFTLVDEDEHEVAFVRDPEELDDASAEALRACFAESYFVPVVTRVNKYEFAGGVWTFHVETDRGPVTFRITNRLYNIKNYGRRFLLRDTDDNRYEIPDWTALDAHSKRLLFSFL